MWRIIGIMVLLGCGASGCNVVCGHEKEGGIAGEKTVKYVQVIAEISSHEIGDFENLISLGYYGMLDTFESRIEITVNDPDAFEGRRLVIMLKAGSEVPYDPAGWAVGKTLEVLIQEEYLTDDMGPIFFGYGGMAAPSILH